MASTEGESVVTNGTGGDGCDAQFCISTTASYFNITDVLPTRSTSDIPADMQFNESHLITIVGYSLLFVLSAFGNLTILIVILRRKWQGAAHFSRIDFMLIHLAVADLMVTVFMMPLEIIWAFTVSWRGGDAMCRTMAFFRIFGLYLSSFVLVCLALDRYLAVKYPMRIIGSLNRRKLMITTAWISSAVISMPQVFIFHEARHPHFDWYVQCVSFGSLSPENEWVYNLFVMLMMYAFPFAVILLLYCGIVVELSHRSRNAVSGTHSASETDSGGLRRSGAGNLGRAKVKTLKMTVIIVVIFFVCWTPYYTMCMWYWIDRSTAAVVDQKIQKLLFLFASTNSAANPIVYGIFHLKSVCTFRATPERRSVVSRSLSNNDGLYRYSGEASHLNQNRTRQSSYRRATYCENESSSIALHHHHQQHHHYSNKFSPNPNCMKGNRLQVQTASHICTPKH